jgi:hypothetical protein
MPNSLTARRRIARGLAIVALTATALVGATAGPASATTSKGYWHKSTCLNAQRAYGGSFTAITKSCYLYLPCANGICIDTYMWRFEYVSRY